MSLFSSQEQANIKVISFDVEGTLVTPDFSYGIWYEAIPQLYAEEKGIKLPEAREMVKEHYQGVGEQRLEWYDIGYWFDHFKLGSPSLALESCKNRVCYYPEVSDVLLSLSQKYKLIVASSSAREFLVYLLRDIKSYFYRVFSSISDYKRLKTPDFYLEICQVLRIKPGEMLHIGDNWQFDFLNAQQSGILALHLDRSKKDNCSQSLSSLNELKLYLEVV